MKRYKRSTGEERDGKTAENLFEPSEVRTVEALTATLDHLLHTVLFDERRSFVKRHNFIRDRMRSILQDLTILVRPVPSALVRPAWHLNLPPPSIPLNLLLEPGDPPRGLPPRVAHHSLPHCLRSAHVRAALD